MIKRILLAALLFLMTGSFSFAGKPGEMNVIYIDVGEGDSILVITPSGKSLLIDGGSPGKEAVIKTHLKKHGIKDRIDMVILSHPLEEHVGGLTGIIEQYDVGSIYDPGMPYSTYIYEKFLEIIMTRQDQHGATGSADEKLSDILSKKMHYEFFNPKAGDILSLDPDVELVVLGPNKLFHNTRSDPKNNSLVVKLVYNQVSFLFTGNTEADAENDLLRLGSKLNATVLKVPNHGSANSSTSRFLNLVKPRASVISCGKNNPHGHPALQTLERLRNVSSRIFRTDLNGSIEVTTDGKGYVVKPERETAEATILAQTYDTTATDQASDNRFLTEKKININTATAEQLVEIPGLGAFKAQMIIRYREKNGNYSSAEDLEKVPGINKAIIDKIREKITF